MITCNLKGGLGNMMFQIAGIKSFARDHNSDVYFYNVREHINVLNTIDRSPCVGYAKDYYSIFKNLNWGANLQYNFKPAGTVLCPFEYKPMNFKDNMCYDNFFQSEKFFAHNMDYIKRMFEFNDDIKTKVDQIFTEKVGDFTNLVTCALHIRRGDYLNYPNIHPTQALDYYFNAMDIIGADKYLVFSDDIGWCKEWFHSDKFVLVSGNKDYVDMALMQNCDHQIICNSSFSWWAAWLNDNKDKKVIAPNLWFGKSDMNSNDIVPTNWIKL